MKRLWFWGAWLAALLLLVALSGSAALAAPLAQDEPPTFTPTPTRIPYGPTWTPTPTLLPIPEGTGRVRVSEAAVRVAPSLDRPVLGRLDYGELVQPFARSANGNWVAIIWEGSIGWVVTTLMEWHPDFDHMTLPVHVPSTTLTPNVLLTGTSILTNTSSPASPTDTPRATITNSPEPTEAPSATLLPAPTEIETAIPAVAALPTQPQTTEPTGPSITVPPVDFASGPWLWLLIGVPVGLATLLYGYRFVSGEREVRRYGDQFVVDICPACQIGELHLEESIRQSLGVAQVTRTVRCDACRSVLRQIEPGVWRYSVDPVVNPALADAYNGKHLTDAEFEALARRAVVDYEPAILEQPLTPDLTDEEILAELEARVALDELEATEASDSIDAENLSPPETPPE